MFLKNIATIRTGLVTARKEAKGPEVFFSKEYRLLGLRCIKDSGILDIEQAEPYTSMDSLKDDFLTRQGDILVRLSAPYTATLVEGESEGFVVPSHFAIIRVDKEKADPYYILWILRQRETLKMIYKNVSGLVAFGTINSNFFSELVIEDLPIEKQTIIGNFLKASLRQQFLLSELAKEHAKLNDNVLRIAYTNLKKGKK